MARKVWAVTRERDEQVGYVTIKNCFTTLTQHPDEALLLARRQDAESLMALVSGPAATGLAVIEIEEPLTLEVQLQDPPKPKRRKQGPSEPALQALARRVWDAYVHAFGRRYAVEPVRNAKQNAMALGVAKRLGDDAPEVVHSYLASQDQFYTRSGHSLDLLLRDAEKLHMEWRTGKSLLATQARRNEESAANPFAAMLNGARSLT